ncbi:hypothetical protein PENTCL1PPCAC_15293, partial [Pristionchus entomophagus]
MNSPILSFMCTLILLSHGASAETWGYGENDGPKRWDGICEKGYRQSPIDIRAQDTDYAPMDRVIFVGYEQRDDVTLQNNGHTVSVDGFENWNNLPYVSGGGLEGKYFLQQIHFHWGQNNSVGSEHRIAGLAYPAEMHLVHLKEGLNMTEAKTRGDG